MAANCTSSPFMLFRGEEEVDYFSEYAQYVVTAFWFWFICFFWAS